MLHKFSVLALLLVLAQFLATNSASLDRSLSKRDYSDYSSVYDDSVDWKTLKVKVIQLESEEKSLSEQQLFSKVEECIKKCMEQVNSNNSVRDQCIASVCDIYKK